METIKVNMSPNPLDVQTIHASQNDTEARQWEFELHNNGELIDTSSVTEQLFFKAYKGGTEQILPENTSTPTTSPFNGDIKYPQGLLADQEFTYRESPTTKDGYAKITSLKGNTLVWNQLVQNGNFADSSGWSTVSSASLTISNNIANITTVNAWSGFGSVTGWNLVSGHKYLFSASYIIRTTNYEVNVYSGNLFDFSTIPCVADNQWHTIQQIITCVQSGQSTRPSFDNRTASGSYSVKNIMLIDLTQMFGAGKEPTLEQFRALFPLPYYSYQSTLLPFKGTSIKTIGKNLFAYSVSALTTNGITFTPQNNGSVKVSGTATANAYFNIYNWANNTIFPLNQSLRLSGGTSQVSFTVAYRNTDGSGTVEAYDKGNGATITIPSADKVIYTALRVLQGITIDTVIYPMVTFADADQTYEPYTSHTTNLPTSTYFPNGMKSAGNVYDELTPNKAITRVGMIDLGSLTWTLQNTTTGNLRFNSSIINDLVLPSSAQVVSNLTCSRYVSVSPDAIWTGTKGIAIDNSTKRLFVCDSAYSTAEAFATAMSGVYLYYELKTPTETSFTTASLVTENAEIPLSNNDGTLIGKCTEELSAEPGFHDAKIKLTDSDGECYSNKIQLHVERSPQ